MLAKRAFALFMAAVVILTMSCCATLQASIIPSSSTTSHACCEKEKDKDKKKDGEKQKHNCQCGEKLTQVAEKASFNLHNLVSVEIPAFALFDIFPAVSEKPVFSSVSDSPPPAGPSLHHLHCIYLI